jgi:hypothetical protein
MLQLANPKLVPWSGPTHPLCREELDTPGLAVPGLATRHVIVEDQAACRQSVGDVAHDLDDLQHDITAGAAGSTSQQILNRGADLRFRIVTVYEIPIEFV